MLVSSAVLVLAPWVQGGTIWSQQRMQNPPTHPGFPVCQILERAWSSVIGATRLLLLLTEGQLGAFEVPV